MDSTIEFETIAEIACHCTLTDTVDKAVEYFETTEDGWDDFLELLNDSRVFMIDKPFTIEEIKNSLM